ncbi:MAG: ATP-binding cassette domain-containing protein [Planctomycetota bacterium]|jgi:excinuclease ABC subunit A|nr:ATP-binding cassette domain-containing protein [Planctomycetota bacterium]
MRSSTISILGASEHNLKRLNIQIPHNRLILLTGVSGSGKSSLALDTLHAEGQRRYVEGLSGDARHHLGQLERPQVDSIRGLLPTLAIDARGLGRNPRSTVATGTEIHDYLRILFARLGIPHCPLCDRPIPPLTIPEMVADIENSFEPNCRILILSPRARRQTGPLTTHLGQARIDGFVRIRLDGTVHDLSETIPVKENEPHDLDIVVDRLRIGGKRARLAGSLELAVSSSGGSALVLPESGPEKVYGERAICLECQITFPPLTPSLFSFNSPTGACSECQGMGFLTETGSSESLPCSHCRGSRLIREARAVRWGSWTLDQLTCLTIDEAHRKFQNPPPGSPLEESIAREPLREIRERLASIRKLGLGYLGLDRRVPTLSSGESRRLRLGTALAGDLTGVLYILDEPTIGLHPHDNRMLIECLHALRDAGNTVLVVEHDRATIRAADQILEFGPGSGPEGGQLVFQGSLEEILKPATNSLTGSYLSGQRQVHTPSSSRPSPRKWLVLRGASGHNLQSIDVRIPLSQRTAVTGVSGAGKTSLVSKTLVPAVSGLSSALPYTALEGGESLQRVLTLDGTGIQSSSRSNPATYTKVFDEIRTFFASLKEAKVRGFKAARFSFNKKGGRCESCQGVGLRRIDMHFLPDVHVPCEICRGKRYEESTLSIQYRGASIADILDSTVDEAITTFQRIERIHRPLRVLQQVGLGYLRLGQPTPTLSGGEKQRLALARELARPSTSPTLYVFDEPTSGLHPHDIRTLLGTFDQLVENGHTVIVVEHDLDVIASSDWIVDLGPGGGPQGGELLAEGTPSEISNHKTSRTGPFLHSLI